MTDDAQKREAELKKAEAEAEKREAKNRKEVAGDDADVQHFETTVAKLVEVENADGDKEWITVMSDNLYPGEKLAREEEEKERKRKDELSRARASQYADERREADDMALKKYSANKDVTTKTDAPKK